MEKSTAESPVILFQREAGKRVTVKYPDVMFRVQGRSEGTWLTLKRRICLVSS